MPWPGLIERALSVLKSESNSRMCIQVEAGPQRIWPQLQPSLRIEGYRASVGGKGGGELDEVWGLTGWVGRTKWAENGGLRKRAEEELRV